MTGPHAASFRAAGRIVFACALLGAAGCLAPLHKRAAALVDAATPVVTSAKDVYRHASALHDERQDYDAAAQYGVSATPYDPRTITPLLSPKDLAVRLAVLDALQQYTGKLQAISAGTDSPALDAATKSAGENLAGLANGVSVALGNSTTSSPLLSTDAQNGIATTVNAIAQLLVQRRIRRDLPAIVTRMDPHIAALCALLVSDLDSLGDIETKDLDFMLEQEKLFLADGHPDPAERRAHIMKLPQLVRRERDSQQEIASLKDAIVKLAQRHHELALAAAGQPPQSLRQKITGLAQAGASLGSFYSSLSSS